MQITMFQVFYTTKVIGQFQPDIFALSGVKTIRDAVDYLNQRNENDVQVMSFIDTIYMNLIELFEHNMPI